MKGRSSGSYAWLKKYHKWISIIFSVFFLAFAFSGIILNHRSLFSGVDVGRTWLPGEYHYNNWNLAAVRGNVMLGEDSSLVYGNIGAWISTRKFSTFSDFNQGFPAGIDNRKISKVVQAQNGELFAGTFFGLYSRKGDKWEKLPLPVEEERVVDLLLIRDSLWILTRSFALMADLKQKPFAARQINIPQPEDYDNKVGLFKTMWVIHSGEIYGLAGKIFMDAIALTVIFLTITGLILWLFPGLFKMLKQKKLKMRALPATMRFSLKWHNRLGYYLAAFLVLSGLTGIFLRPPLLITIAEARVGKIPFTILSKPNPWYDKFRAIQYDRSLNRLILNTSEGFYYSDGHFNSTLLKYDFQPPVSVMGINVFEILEDGSYLVGSFSGLFRWLPSENHVWDVFEQRKWSPAKTAGPPFGAHSVSGFVKREKNETWVFDYAGGAFPVQHKHPFPKMPANIIESSPISLWNFALEVHTARIYHFLIGDFYILVVPLTGLALIFIVVTGFIMYWKKFRKSSRHRTMVQNTKGY